MSNIFLWLWLADVFHSINGLSWLVVFGYGIGFLVCVLCFVMTCNDGDSLSEQAGYVFNMLSKHMGACIVLLCPLLFALIFIVALPSKTTIYVGLGASVTTDIVQNPTTQKALQLLNNKLDDLLIQKEEVKND